MNDVQGTAFLTTVVKRFCMAGVLLCLVSLLMPGYLRPGWGSQVFVGSIAASFAVVAVLAARFGVSATGLLGLALFVDGCAAALPPVLQDHAVGMVPLVALSLPCVVVALYGSVLRFAVQTVAMLAAATEIATRYTDRPGSVAVIVLVSAITLTGPAVVVAALRRRLADALERERRQARVDPLTQVANRRGMAESMDGVLRRSTDTGLPVGVIVVDVDHFKQVNDQLGHREGDRVLQAVSAVLSACIRSDDVLARFGGEEFVVLAVAAPEQLVTLAERIRAAVADSEFTGVTVSVGAAWNEPAAGPVPVPVPDDVWRLIERGDELMYAAKRAGRNRVHTA